MLIQTNRFWRNKTLQSEANSKISMLRSCLLLWCNSYKNARIHSHDRFAELATKFYNVDRDVMNFSETRSARGRCRLDGGHVFYTLEIATQAAGVAILLHSKHVHRVGQVTSLNERPMFLDLHYGRRCVRFISLYMPHARYSVEDLRTVYDMLHVVLDEAERLHYKIIVGGDFNTESNVGHRFSWWICMRVEVASCELWKPWRWLDFLQLPWGETNN